MSDQHKEWEDDGRTVADMSGLDRLLGSPRLHWERGEIEGRVS